MIRRFFLRILRLLFGPPICRACGGTGIDADWDQIDRPPCEVCRGTGVRS